MPWIGTPGYLRKLKCPASMPVSRSLPAVIETTLGGADKAQTAPAPTREWSLDMSAASPADVHTLDGFDHGLYGPGPWTFVDEWAELTNVVTPRKSMPGGKYRAGWSGDAVAAGAADIPGVGRVSHALLSGGGTVVLASGTPVLPGRPVTAAVHVSGTAQATFNLRVYDAAGVQLSTTTTSRVLTPVYQRPHITLPAAPPGAATVTLRVTGALGVALPSVTWTDTLTPWVAGQGASAVRVDSHRTDPVRAVRGGAVLATQTVSIVELRGGSA